VSDLSPDARRLLQKARADLSPGESDVVALRAAVSARIAAGGAMSGGGEAHGAGGTPPGASGSFGWFGGTAGKVVGAILLAGAVGGVAGWASHRFAPPAMALPPVVSAAAPPSRAPMPGGVDPVRDPGPQAIPVEQLAVAPPLHVGKVHRPRAAPPKEPEAREEAREEQNEPPVVAQPAAAPSEGAASLALETQLLREAQASLDHGDPDGALARVHQHELRFPRGTLVEERLVLRVLALCALGRTEAARAAARQVQQSAPDSPHLAGLRSSCVGADLAR
jgi:hypothetical protein